MASLFLQPPRSVGAKDARRPSAAAAAFRNPLYARGSRGNQRGA